MLNPQIYNFSCKSVLVNNSLNRKVREEHKDFS